MIRSAVRAGSAVCVCLLAAGGWLVARGPQQRPTFRAGANLVTVDVYPQRDGRIVDGLTAADFDVFEDGKPQKIESFEFVRVEPAASDAERREPRSAQEADELAADPRNRVFVLYLDTNHVTADGSHRTRPPLVSMLERLSAPGDLYGVVTPPMRPTDLTFTRSVAGIDQRLLKMGLWGMRQGIRRTPQEDFLYECYTLPPTGPDPNWWVTDGGARRLLADVVLERYREDATLTSLERLVPHLGALREARTILLVFTDGWVLFQPNGEIGAAAGRASSDRCAAELQRLNNLDDQQRLHDLIDLANRNNVSFYPVAPGGLQAFDTSVGDRIEFIPGSTQGVLQRELQRVQGRSGGLRTLAENTNGVAVVDTNDVAAGLNRIVNDVSASYLLGYYTTNSKADGKVRQIQVKVRQPGLKVKARKSYVAPTAAESSVARAAAASVAAGPTPIDDALGALARTRAGSEIFTYGVAVGTELQVVTEIASAQIEAGKWANGADVQATVTGASGAVVGAARARIEPATRGVLVHVPLPAGATGPWLVRVSVTSGADSLDDRAEVRQASGAVLGDPLVFRGTPAPRSPLRAVADFQFRRTERVHVEWPILDALDRREARVLDRKGQPLSVAATVTERELAPGAIVLAADVNLAPLAEGDYLVEVVAGSGARSTRKLVAFQVIR